MDSHSKITSILYSLIVVSLTIFQTSPLWGEVYFAKDEALKRAFPTATSIEQHTEILTEERWKHAQKRARTKIDSKLITFFEGRDGSGSLGYAFIDSKNVRTHSATYLVKIAPDGKVQDVFVLAFHEPPEYLPSERWLEQFLGEPLSPGLAPGRDIIGIVGSSLTAHAISDGVRKALALFDETIGIK